MVLEKKKATQPKNFYQPVRNRTTCWAKISQCHLQDTLAMWQESSRKKLLWRAVEIDTYPVRHPHVKYIPHKHSQPHSHTHKTHMQISRSLNGFREKLREVEIDYWVPARVCAYSINQSMYVCALAHLSNMMKVGTGWRVHWVSTSRLYHPRWW